MTIFSEKRRQQFRRYYQPTRVLLALVPAPTDSGVNVITLCFTMTCSYKPPMMAFSIHKHAFSYGLFDAAKECVLAVPGESLCKEVTLCGTRSGRDIDKVRECGFSLQSSECVGVPSMSQAIANLELRLERRTITGDHMTVIGRVLRFGVNTDSKERNLLSVGPEHEGFAVLDRKGIHRIGVVGR